jgi:hypothetical protein
LIDYRIATKNKFRKNFIEYFETEKTSMFKFYKLEMPNLETFVNDNFKILNGKCFSLTDKILLIALHESDIGSGSLKEFLSNKTKIDLSENSEDVFKFNINKPKEDSMPYFNIETKLNLAADIESEYGT